MHELRLELALLKQLAQTQRSEPGLEANLHEKQLAISAYVNLFVQKQRQKEGILQQEYEKQTARLLAEKRDTEERFMQIRLQ